MVADGLSKILTRDKHKVFLDILGLKPQPSGSVGHI